MDFPHRNASFGPSASLLRFAIASLLVCVGCGGAESGQPSANSGGTTGSGGKTSSGGASGAQPGAGGGATVSSGGTAGGESATGGAAAGNAALGGAASGGVALGGSGNAGAGQGGSGTGGLAPAAGGSGQGGGAGSVTTTGGGGGLGTGGAGGGPDDTGGTGGTSVGGSTGGSLPAGPFPTQACLDQANALLAQMTADEKYAQMLQMERATVTPAEVTQYGVGSVFSQGGSAPPTNSPSGWADMADSYRQAALASRLKIPVIYGADEVHGVGTVNGAVVFPHNIGLGATRDLGLIGRVAQVTASEALGTGVDFLFSPVVAVARDEHWGRTYEAFGETTELASTMGAAMISGVQFTATGSPTGILTNAKHYVGDGGTTNGVNNGQVVGDEAALRAIHLEPYRAAVAARVGSVMASYSSWQGTSMHVNRAMITDTLKGELGFGGFVISDFNACDQLGIGSCMNAGVDMFMLYSRTNSTANRIQQFASLVSAGTVAQSRIDDAVRRILAVKCEMGLFDRASDGSDNVDRSLTAQVGSAEHRSVAREAVQKSLVVLKNDGNVLPLAKTGPIALGGNSADNTGNQCGGWTITWQGSSGNEISGATSVRQALTTVLGSDGVVYSAAGTSVTGASVGIVVVGETPYAEGVGDEDPLPQVNATAVQSMKNAGLKTVVVLIAGRPMLLDPILDYADAIVMAWLPGSEAAGITDVLFGDVSPTGKLPHSWPRTDGQIPINTGDSTYDPLYPYGHGLTY